MTKTKVGYFKGFSNASDDVYEKIAKKMQKELEELNGILEFRNNLNALLIEYIKNPGDPEINFSLAIYYHNHGQTASAVSYYLRTAERTDDDLLKYECLIRASMCFDTQGCRSFTVRGLLQHAIAILPKRPEAYYLLSRFYERENKVESWKESYFIASIGHAVCEFDNNPPLRTQVDYPGNYAILFEKAVSSWWCGLCDESRELFIYLRDNYDLDEIHRNSVEHNLQKLNETKKDLHTTHLPKKYRDFNWGLCAENEWFKKTVEKEIFLNDIYQKHFSVEEGDIVFDVGSSVGPFTYSILDKKPSKVFCFEPHPDLFQTLQENLNNTEVDISFSNKAILGVDGETKTAGLFNEKLTETCAEENTRVVDAVTFKSFIEDNNITHIDFLKTDCEGGEYDIFNEENFEWIRNNVSKITGEWHLSDPELKEKFRKFRDNYLKPLGNYKIDAINGVDITHEVLEDWFIDYYGIITVYIDNRENVKNYREYKKYFPQPKQKTGKKWENSIAPTLEFTTSIPEKGCVVDCVFCPQRTLEKKYTGERFLSLENFKKVVDKLPQEIRVTFAGFTEPWLNKYASDMLLYAHEKGHPISVFTTGIGMGVKDVDMIKHVPYAGNPNGGFTLHLPDNERRAKHPITKRYIEVLERFKEVQHQIQNFTLMCMGTVHDDVKHIFPEAPRYEMWSRAGNLIGESMLKPELLNIKEEYKSIYHGEQPMTCGCLEDLYHNILLPNGDISLCCMDYNLDHILGNLFEQEYDEVMPEMNTCYNLCRFCENAKKPS